MSLAFDANPRFGVFTLRTECPRCGALLPANGPWSTLTCGDCAATVAVPAGLLRDLADNFEDQWPRVQTGDSVTLGDLTWRWTAAAAEGPACVGCGATLSADADKACECGETTPSYAPPDVLRDSVRNARRVFGLEQDVVTEAPVAPVAMVCPQCGAGLTITQAAARLSPCAHCGVSVHLPDAVWRALHPARTARPWSVRFDGESRAARRARVAEQKQEEEKRKQEKRKEDQRNRQELAEAQRKRDAEANLEKAKKAAEAKAESERRWHRSTLPFLVLSWIGLPPALVGVACASAWHLFGTPIVLLGRVSPEILAQAPRVVVFLGLGGALLGWALSVLGAARRSRQNLADVGPLAAFQLLIASLPVIGWIFALVFAFLYLRGSEPTIEGARPVPMAARPPLAAYILVFSGYSFLVLSAALGIPMATMWQNFLTD